MFSPFQVFFSYSLESTKYLCYRPLYTGIIISTQKKVIFTLWRIILYHKFRIKQALHKLLYAIVNLCNCWPYNILRASDLSFDYFLLFFTLMPCYEFNMLTRREKYIAKPQTRLYCPWWKNTGDKHCSVNIYEQQKQMFGKQERRITAEVKQYTCLVSKFATNDCYQSEKLYVITTHEEHK